MPFNNSILGGMGTLIRQMIRSPNYVPNVSGWSINKDGTAEFQNIKARGDLSGSTLTIPPGATIGARIVIDTVNGITLYNAANQIVFQITEASIAGEIFAGGAQVLSSLFGPQSLWFGPNSGVAGNPDWQLLANGDFVITNQAHNTDLRIGGGPSGLLQAHDVSGAGPNRIALGHNGLMGAYYSEEFSLSAQSLVTNTVTTMINLVKTHSQNDNLVTTQMVLTTGVWTCPDDGDYHFDFCLLYTVAMGAAQRWLQWAMGGILAAPIAILDIGTAGTNGNTLSFTRFVAKGDTVTFQALQASGANKIINTVLSYIKIRREP